MDIYRDTKKGAQGIGTLIIFIAMILVAAVAAGVLIQTASSLQSKSLDVGRQSQERLTTDIDIIQLFASDTSDGLINDGSDNFTFVLRLSSGSVAVKLSDLLLKFDTADGSQALTYSGNDTYNSILYGITYKINGSNHVDGYLSSGDLAEISYLYDLPGASIDIVEGSGMTLRLITKNGAVKPIQVTAPSAMTEQVVYLYP